MSSSEVSREGESPTKRSRLSLNPFHSFPDRYFVYENEEYSHVIALVDEDTVLYGNHDPYTSGEYIITASKNKKQFRSVLYVNEEGKTVPVDLDQDKVETLDIGGLGERWEGPTLGEMPFGWGKRYDEDGELVYEGFSVLDRYSLYGTEFDSDNHTVTYIGTWCDGRRCGIGESYDLHGCLLRKGEWAADKPINTWHLSVPNSTESLPPIGSLLISLRIGENCCNSNSSLHLIGFPRLRELVVDDDSFCKGNGEDMEFVCVDCPELVSIIIGESVMQFFYGMIVSGGNKIRE